MIAVILISLIVLVVIGIVVAVASMPNDSKCNGNCNQGRNCDCREK